MRLSEQVEMTQYLLHAAYDVGSFGIPARSLLLEELVAGEPMSPSSEHIFCQLHRSNLLNSNILTGGTKENQRDAVDYFGKTMYDTLQERLQGVRKMGSGIESALARKFFFPDKPIDVSPLTLADVLGFLRESVSRGYVQEMSGDGMPELGMPDTLLEFIWYVKQQGGTWTQKGYDKLEDSYQLCLTEPFFSMAIPLHVKSADLMNTVFGFVVEKTDKIHLSDIHRFDSKRYFGSSWHEHWQNRLQEWFTRYCQQPVMSASELLLWGQSAVAKTKEKYQIP